jgi:hypothetical protein
MTQANEVVDQLIGGDPSKDTSKAHGSAVGPSNPAQNRAL